MKKLFLLPVFIGLLVYWFNGVISPVHALVCGEQPDGGDWSTVPPGVLRDYITDCKSKISDSQGAQRTLGAAIDFLTNQISLTQAQIYETQAELNTLNLEITDLSGKIESLDYSLTDLTKLFVARVRETYIYRASGPFTFVAETSGLSDLLRSLEYTKRVRNHDQELLLSLESARLTFNTQKSEKETVQAKIAAAKRKLDSQKADLNNQVAAKNRLLADTKNSESQFQKLLSAAQAQLASLASYAESVGVSLLPHQDLSDSWGKYYNQRDAQWGNVVVNGSYDCGGACTIARIGCLLSSYAMVTSHFGGSLNPQDVATNASNFYSITALFNSPGPSANGHNATDMNNPSLQTLRDALNSGKVVIAGLSMNGGPAPQHFSDHWVVLRAQDGDSFKINDPEYPGAMNVSLNDHYSSWSIIQAKIYN